VFIGSFLHLIIPLATAVSLSDFQRLTFQVSENCEIAYDRTIPSCTAADFIDGDTCSPGCVSGLNQIANGVLDSCVGVVVGSSTLLGRIFNGDIISSLCPNNGGATSAAQSATAAPTKTAQSTSQAVKSTSTQSSAAALSSSSTTAASSSSSASVQSSSSAASLSSTTAVAANGVSSSTTSSAAAQTSMSQSQTQSGNGRSGLTVQQQQIAAIAKSGGGSPFDIIGYSAASRPLQRDLIVITLGIALIISGWLLR
jgi:hypothetical protein